MDMPSRGTGLDHDEAMQDFAAPMAALIGYLTGVVRRQYLVFLAAPALAIAVGLAYLLMTVGELVAFNMLSGRNSPSIRNPS